MLTRAELLALDTEPLTRLADAALREGAKRHRLPGCRARGLPRWMLAQIVITAQHWAAANTLDRSAA